MALSVYNTNVRNIAAYAGALLLNERKPTISAQRLMPPGQSFTSQDAAFGFSFTVYRSKTAVTAQFAIEPVTNIPNLDVTTTVQGMVYAPSEVAGEAYITSLYEGLSLGIQV